ncbi:MAG: type II secretion system protein GspD [Verrucomicrobia bacterium]|nr:type II secretion system protein GspD [Verrucomicrobiota bacterium]
MKRIIHFLWLATAPLWSQTISDKRSQLGDRGHVQPTQFNELKQVNRELAEARSELRSLHELGRTLAQEGGSERDLSLLIQQIQTLRKEIEWMEESFRQSVTEENQGEGYALWHQPWTSIEQLLLDYGSPDYVYLIPPEVGGMRLSVASNIPVPRQSWDEMLIALLAENGIGVRHLSPFVRQLFITENEWGNVTLVVAKEEELPSLPPHERICFVLHAKDACEATAELVTRLFQKRVHCHVSSTHVYLFGPCNAIQEVLRLYTFIAKEAAQRQHQLLALSKIGAKEMARLIEASLQEESSLKVLPLEDAPYALYLFGPPEEISKAMKIAEEVEKELSNPKAMTVHSYIAKHTDVEELGYALSAVYNLLLANPTAGIDETYEKVRIHQSEKEIPNLPIHPKPVSSNRLEPKAEGPSVSGNFVVYPKAGTMIMVVEQELLPRLLQLLKKLDVPKKMVRIDVLFFEKKLEDRSRFGLDLFNLHSQAKGQDGVGIGLQDGILSFLLSSAKTKHVPAYNFTYNFLLGQEDIHINANPSVTTLNNTPAKIELVEEMSIDTGVYVDDDSKNKTLKQSFSRQQYGIIMSITPTVHTSENGESTINLVTDLLFDTPKPSSNDRPPVLRRHVTNEVRVRDGETVILGGLRSKLSEDESTSLPFLGEIPGIGKIFSSTKIRDRENEMFIFITPHLIDSPEEEMRRLRQEQLSHRPGDTPEFLEQLQEARAKEKNLLFHRTFKTLFGKREE